MLLQYCLDFTLSTVRTFDLCEGVSVLHLQTVCYNRIEGKQPGITRTVTCSVTHNCMFHILHGHCPRYTIAVKNALLWRVKKSFILLEEMGHFLLCAVRLTTSVNTNVWLLRTPTQWRRLCSAVDDTELKFENVRS